MYFDTIAELISDRTGMDKAAIRPESKFTDLGIDSLDTVELLMKLEDITGTELELDREIVTVEDLDKFVQEKKG